MIIFSMLLLSQLCPSVFLSGLCHTSDSHLHGLVYRNKLSTRSDGSNFLRPNFVVQNVEDRPE